MYIALSTDPAKHPVGHRFCAMLYGRIEIVEVANRHGRQVWLDRWGSIIMPTWVQELQALAEFATHLAGAAPTAAWDFMHPREPGERRSENEEKPDPLRNARAL